MTAEEVISHLKLSPLNEEGGFFRSTYVSKGRLSTGHAYSSAIYYLVTPESFSKLHKLPQDEIFHFYAGSPVQMLRIRETGESDLILLGNNLSLGHEPQVLVEGNVWQGTKLEGEGKWALLGTTVCPGFDAKDFVLAKRSDLVTRWPNLRHWIEAYT
jgi:predicted cupin superfamily sugar epimerase